MLYLKQSTASQPVLLGPFVDDTDGATAETGLTIANTDIRLSANGDTMFAKTSGGGTHAEAGWYKITLDATDTATVGRLQISCKVAGALHVFMECQVLEEAIYDALFAASAAAFDANQRVDVGLWLGTAVTTSATTSKPEVDVNSISDDATAANNAELMFDGTGYAGGTTKLDVNVASEDDIDFGATKKASINTEVDAALDTALPASPTAGSINDILDRQEELIVKGTAQTGTLSTTEMTTDLTITVADQYNGRILTFRKDTSTAALQGQQTDITATTVLNGKLGFTALTTAPANGDVFDIT